jgi:hypothetical protein
MSLMAPLMAVRPFSALLANRQEAVSDRSGDGTAEQEKRGAVPFFFFYPPPPPWSSL